MLLHLARTVVRALVQEVVMNKLLTLVYFGFFLLAVVVAGYVAMHGLVALQGLLSAFAL